ncbi:MAG: aquaporin [Actinomycetota bacterium]|nr:aquaporin [Actinomycetota bacterium]
MAAEPPVHPGGELGRRVAAEALGTGFLVTAVIGSGIAATRLSPGQPGLQLLENSLATGAVLVALILAFQPVSAAFNPVVTLVERATGLIDTRVAGALIGGQVLGGIAGAVVANLMFDLPAVTVAGRVRGGTGQLLAELVATLGLVLVVFGTLRRSRAGRGGRGGRGGPRRGDDRVAYAVGGYIAAAYWFTSSTSFANPAVTVARTLSDTFAGIAPTSVPGFVLAQLLGAGAALLVLLVVYPATSQEKAHDPA